MENKNIELTINENDGVLYDYIKNCRSIEYIKMYLKDAVELYLYCNGDGGIQEGHPTPENYRNRILKGKTKDELNQIKNDLVNKILLISSDFHPDECDCGIMRGPDTEYWFIDEDSRLGFITLYANYIKMIDEILKRKNTDD